MAHGKYRPSVTRVSSRLTIQMRKYSLPEPLKVIASMWAGGSAPGRAALPVVAVLPALPVSAAPESGSSGIGIVSIIVGSLGLPRRV